MSSPRPDLPHPDSLRLAALLADHDESNGNLPAADGTIAGYDSFALLGAAAHRAHLMTEGFGTLRKTLNAQQLDELQGLLAVMWKDGFAVGARSQQPAA
ncbi:hypothetical protein ACFV4X_33935 [Streptomyces ardesiacus]|uniref:hypothetical protein n=1 Tax=Streptomyces ardesiacus TaxID=285564 RepID=UPI003656D471